MTLNNTIYSKDEKIDLIFSYIFSDKEAIEEQNFWNELKNNEINNLSVIDKEETFDFSILKSKIL